MTLLAPIAALLLLFGSFLILRALLDAERDDLRQGQAEPAEKEAPDYRRAA